MGVDNVISVMVTVSDVEVSNDLQVVKVFVSILGDERGKQNAIGLKKWRATAAQQRRRRCRCA